MGIETLQSAIPDYAKDLRLNLSVLSTSSLDPAAAWGSAYTAALVSKNATVKQAILEEARAHLSTEQIDGCRAAAAIMSMTNVWYKFNDLVTDPEVKGLPAKLRMNVIMSHGGIGQVLFESFSLAASVVNACECARCAIEEERCSCPGYCRCGAHRLDCEGDIGYVNV
jgi:alkyl hydroperoxide reductase subunit D